MIDYIIGGIILALLVFTVIRIVRRSRKGGCSGLHRLLRKCCACASRSAVLRRLRRPASCTDLKNNPVDEEPTGDCRLFSTPAFRHDRKNFRVATGVVSIYAYNVYKKSG